MKWYDFVAITGFILVCMAIGFKFGYEVHKRSIIINPKGTINEIIGELPKHSGKTYDFVTKEELQKELTDFANKQREFYKKTHDGGVK